jgi:hypothetical protein
MEINPFMILSAVMLGAIIWGVSGMVLFVPFLGILKALVESNPEWNKYALLFSSGEGDKRNRMKNFASKILKKKISQAGKTEHQKKTRTDHSHDQS